MLWEGLYVEIFGQCPKDYTPKSEQLNLFSPYGQLPFGYGELPQPPKPKEEGTKEKEKEKEVDWIARFKKPHGPPIPDPQPPALPSPFSNYPMPPMSRAGPPLYSTYGYPSRMGPPPTPIVFNPFATPVRPSMPMYNNPYATMSRAGPPSYPSYGYPSRMGPPPTSYPPMYAAPTRMAPPAYNPYNMTRMQRPVPINYQQPIFTFSSSPRIARKKKAARCYVQ